MRPLLFLLLAAPLALAQTTDAPPPATYVAMGSSFAAGPGIPKPDPASPPRCARSTENYAHLLAATLGLVLRDVSCSGATTADILEGSAALPPQLDAVTPATRLVTVTIGGNDVGFIRNLYAWSCQNEAATQPAATGSEPPHCGAPMSPADVDAAFAALGPRLQAIVQRIHQRAPAARVVFVDYIAVVPASGSCPARLPLTPDQLAQARATAQRLAALTAQSVQAVQSARAATTPANPVQDRVQPQVQVPVLILKASDLSATHDVCSAAPWATPFHRPADTPTGPFAPYHPNAQAMRTLAAQLAELLQPSSAHP